MSKSGRHTAVQRNFPLLADARRLYALTVLYDVVLLRKQGQRLRRADWPPFLRGDLRITEMDRAGNGSKRNLLCAHLWQAFGTTRRRGLATLFDPVLLPYKDDGLLIAGIDLSSTDGGRVVYEHRQIWLCTSAKGTEAEWERETYYREHPES